MYRDSFFLNEVRCNIPIIKEKDKSLFVVDIFAILTVMEKHIKLKKVKRARKHGFLSRMSTHSGQKVIKRRRDKNRQDLSI